MSERPIVNVIVVQVPTLAPAALSPPPASPATPPAASSRSWLAKSLIAAVTAIVLGLMTMVGPHYFPPAPPTPPALTMPAAPARAAHDVSTCSGPGGP
jgi:hypothetical protein